MKGVCSLPNYRILKSGNYKTLNLGVPFFCNDFFLSKPSKRKVLLKHGGLVTLFNSNGLFYYSLNRLDNMRSRKNKSADKSRCFSLYESEGPSSNKCEHLVYSILF